MNKKSLFSFALGMMACATSSWAGVQETMNQPDSVYLFAYTQKQNNGTSGLQMAWSADGQQWKAVGDGRAYVKSDFGRWGSNKRMYSPRLFRENGKWVCIWTLRPGSKDLSRAESIDMDVWKPQDYKTAANAPEWYARYTATNKAETPATITLNGTTLEGYTQKVAYKEIQDLNRIAAARAYESVLESERMAQDNTRFKGLQTVNATITVHPDQKTAISDHLIGIFFEDISHSADGGLYAEQVRNRDFEFNSADRGGWTATTAWKLEGANAKLTVSTDNPIHPNNAHYAVLDIAQPGASLVNEGFDGITLKKGEKYDFSLFAKVLGGKGGKVRVSIKDKDGKEAASTIVNVKATDWKKLSTKLTASSDVNEGTLAVAPLQSGKYGFDMISLFPQKTFKNRKNGLRADLAQTLADLHPKFVRFPGGCVAHGDGLDNIYDWKGSIGPLEARKPLKNLWGYHQTRGLGYYEYFQFCEDIGASPLPVLAAGVSCQNSATPSRYSKDYVTTHGQQGGIPMKDMPQYVQDVLDLIEYANGSTKTKWGKKRAEAGHPKPFNLKYVGIGNEDLISNVFKERFEMIYKAVKEKHPEITVIGTVGPFWEGSDYEEGWNFASKLGVPMVDEHYYCQPGWFINHQNYYDGYDRKKPKVYLGEYAARVGQYPNMETSLSEAIYLTNVERNGDVVSMTSYAPLLAKEKRVNWNPDMIYFNNTEIKPSTSYYVQQMFGQNSGDHYLESDLKVDNRNEKVRKRVGVSVVTDSKTGDTILKLANLLPAAVKTTVNLPQLAGTHKAVQTVLSGKPSEENVKPVVSQTEISKQFTKELPPYSFTVIRIKANK